MNDMAYAFWVFKCQQTLSKTVTNLTMKNHNILSVIVLCFLAVLFFTQPGFAQNQVINPGFEQGSVPNNQSQLHFASNWSHYKGECVPYNASVPITHPSSDLFDKNSSSTVVGVPNNKWTTPAGLPERTNKNRYAGIDSRSFSPTSLSEERIRGTLLSALAAGGYDLTLFLARAENKYLASNPLLDPVNFYSIEVVLRKGNDCNSSKIIYTSPNITNFQWQQYGTTFVISQSEANIYDRVEIRMKQFPLNEIGQFDARSMFIDDVDISPVVCNLNASFSTSITCNESSNTVSINVSNNGPNPAGTAHQYNIYEMNSFTTADANIVSTVGFINAASGSYSVPNVYGKIYMIKHGVWTSTCSWREQRQVISIPFSFSGAVNSDFGGAIVSPAGASPYINVSAAVTTNVLSDWIVFKSPVNTYPNISSWGLHVLVGNGIGNPTHHYTIPNLQHGMYYLVRHISKTNCSDLDYTDKIFYVFAKSNLTEKGEKMFDYELVSEETYAVTEEEHKGNMEGISEMSLETNETQLVQIYPNPASDNVSLKSNLILDGSQVEVIDKFGKTVYSDTWKAGSYINVSSWEKGLYILKIKTAKTSLTKKLIIE